MSLGRVVKLVEQLEREILELIEKVEKALDGMVELERRVSELERED